MGHVSGEGWIVAAGPVSVFRSGAGARAGWSERVLAQ